MIELKKKYNKLLERYKKAEMYMDDNEIEIGEREKFVKALQDLTEELSGVLAVISVYSRQDALYGFVIEDEVLRWL